MIKFKRRPPEPAELKSVKVRRVKKRIEELVKNQGRAASKEFTAYWQADEVRKPLWEHQGFKCCYCERKRDLKRESDVEHYRPKAEIEDDPSHPGYWWLAYEWTNYLISCKSCNQAYKKNHFPLLANGSRARRQEDNLADEKPVILNPFDDNPEECIGFYWKDCANRLVKAVGDDDEGRGDKTIKLTAINDPKPAEDRGDLLLLLEGTACKMQVAKHRGLEPLIQDAAAEIERETKSNQQFAGFRRAFFRKYNLSQYISRD